MFEFALKYLRTERPCTMSHEGYEEKAEICCCEHVTYIFLHGYNLHRWREKTSFPDTIESEKGLVWKEPLR